MFDNEQMLDALEDMVRQHCRVTDLEGQVKYDSMALSADADAMRLLAQAGRFTIHGQYGRRIIGQFEEDTDA